MRKPELAGLTGVRFYAALLVFLSHVTILPGMDVFSGRMLVFNAGVVGVSFFFVLSGFILTYNYSDLFQNSIFKSDYQRFVWDRLTKIYPVHLLMLAAMIPLQLMSPNKPLDWRAVPFHFLLSQCFWPFTTPDFYAYLNVPSWSISCEWLFYLLAPLLLFLALGSSRRWILAGIVLCYLGGMLAILSSAQSDYSRLYFLSWFAPSRCIDFIIGVAVGVLYLRVDRGRIARLSNAYQVLGLTILIAGACYRQFAPWPFWGGLLYLPGSAMFILGLAGNRGLFVGHLGQPLLLRLGTASFSFYMIHVPVIRSMRAVYLRMNWGIQSWYGYWATIVGFFLLIECIAIVVCYRFEIPVQQYLRRRMKTRLQAIAKQNRELLAEQA